MAGTEMVGTETAGAEMAGTETAGAEMAGTETVGGGLSEAGLGGVVEVDEGEEEEEEEEVLSPEEIARREQVRGVTIYMHL